MNHLCTLLSILKTCWPIANHSGYWIDPLPFLICIIHCAFINAVIFSLISRKEIFYDFVKSIVTSSRLTSDKNVKMTGLSKQYLSIKNKYPEFIVLFQVGDFYEIYSSDAVKVAEKTSLRISRNPNVNKLMAGFPVRSLDSWLSTLVQQGFQLAICPQFPDKWVK